MRHSQIPTVIAIALVALTATQLNAQLQQDLYRASDGTTYQVLRATSLVTGAEQVRVTTIAASTGGTGSCSLVA